MKQKRKNAGERRTGLTKAASMGRAATSNPFMVTHHRGAKHRAMVEKMNGEERERYLSSIEQAAKEDLGTAWVGFYDSIECLRESGRWKEKGYKTFEAYWKDLAGWSGEKWESYEATHRFMSVIAPNALNIPRMEAVKLCRQLAELREAGAVKHGKGGRPKKNRNGQNVFSSPVASTPGDVNAENELRRVTAPVSEDWLEGCRAGSNNLKRRYQKLLRDHPMIAEKFCRGEYVHQLKNKSWKLGLDQAEKEAGMYVNRSRYAKKSGVDKAMTWIEKLLPVERQELMDAMIRRWRSLKH